MEASLQKIRLFNQLGLDDTRVLTESELQATQYNWVASSFGVRDSQTS
jgi:hypothetical protein